MLKSENFVVYFMIYSLARPEFPFKKPPNQIKAYFARNKMF